MILAITEDAYKRRYQPGAGPAPVMLFRDREPGYQIRGRTAVLTFDGVVGRGSSWFWGTMADPADLVAALRQAEADPEVDDILLLVNSPGGECIGVHEAHMALRGGTKKSRAHVVGMCASAAYWIASGADAVTASPVAAVGCIGAIVEGCDDTEAMEKWGYRFKVLRSARTPDKAPDVADDRWDDEMQPLLDEIGDRFLADIGAARGWGDDLDAIATRVESGRLFPAKAALAAGLIDEITTDETTAGGEAPTAPPQTRAESPRPKEPTAMAGENDTGAEGLDEMKKKLSDTEAERDEMKGKVEELEAELAEYKKKADAEASAAEAKASAEAKVEQLTAALRTECATRHAETALQTGRLVPKERDGFINALAPFVDDAIRAAKGWDDLCRAASAAGANVWSSCFGIRARGESWSPEAKTHGGAPEGTKGDGEKGDKSKATLAARIEALKAEKDMSHNQAVDYLREHEPELLGS